MNTIKTNTGTNIDDYEDMAVQKSNVAKRVAAGAAVFVPGGIRGPHHAGGCAGLYPDGDSGHHPGRRGGRGLR